jgi:hypothetical protein
MQLHLHLRDRFTVYKSKYFYMLMILITYFVAVSVLSSSTESLLPTSFLFSLTVILCAYIILREQLLIYYIFCLGGLAVISHHLINFTSFDIKLYLIYYVTDVLFLTLGTFTVLYAITQHKEVTADTLFGAICGYFLLGLTWSFIYLLIDIINPGSFSHQLSDSTLHRSALNASYYSFTTMTTLGYGDILPVSYLARTCSWLEAVSGQIYLAVWISQLVGLRIAQNR